MSIDAIVLFSGGLDSILAAKVLQAQGLKTICLHYISPFFGERAAIGRWRRLYNLEIECREAGNEFAAMLGGWPAHGFGKTLNPCVDCKILLLKLAREAMLEMGAKFIATGEVIGQRPMSQRRDSLFLIGRDAGIRDILLRPLCAHCLPPTHMEEIGLVRRELLLGINGRGRQAQLELAEKFGISPIPAPGGGCRLTERENARRYWQVLKNGKNRNAPPDWSAIGPEEAARLNVDFELANIGRQFWRDGCWLCVGRNNLDNDSLRTHAAPDDVLLKLCDFSGPIALCRGGATWPDELLASAAGLMASYSPKAVGRGGKIRVSLKTGDGFRIMAVEPGRDGWGLQTWEEVKQEIKETAKALRQ